MKDKKVIKIIIIIVIVLLIAFIGFEFFNKNKGKNNKNNNKEDIYDINKIVNDEKSYNDFISSIPYSNETMSVYKDAYSQDKTIINDVVGQAVISTFINYDKKNPAKGEYEDFVYYMIKSQGIDVEKIYLKDTINELLTKNYDIKLNTYDISESIEITDFDFGYCAIKYDKKDTLKQTKITLDMNMAESNGEIVALERALFVVLKGDTYYVYPDSNINNGQEPLKEFSSDNRKIYEIYDYLKEEFKDYKTVSFKHTFKKNTTGYYWYSTEMLKQ